ncbi:Ig-like domain-containing protein [Pelagibacterium luteolum]|uniref:Carbohydrate-binding module family 96 domain-containing protein n=1 Tax=Pelagibacterium luteolum TaxID=440168 RepID=A0A1G7S357_9HYPH|nr:Ig-like domain-containing protein [Pelagibacterium luteolum]SDG17401.1 hypothetical protein SAMN04487974_101274 [Pelagibacterium luteolum]
MQEFETTFRQGVNGYASTVDTQLLQANTGANHANTAVLGVDRNSHVQVLLRFDDLFGNAVSQVPAGAEILSATLTLHTTNTGDGATLHRMLTNWSGNSTWSSTGSGIQTNGVEALAAADVNTGSTNLGASNFDVTASVQAWAGGQANLGWVFVSLGTNGWDFYSAQGATPPQLTIRYRIEGEPNTAPVANPDTVVVDEDGSATVNVLANDADADGDTLVVSGVGTPANGVAVLNGNGTITYTPHANFFGNDSFSYTLSDGKGGQSTGQVSVTVNPVNDAPVATGDTASVNEGGNVVVTVLSNDSDIDGDALSVSGVGTPSNGTAVINSNGTITYTPNAGYTGPDSFSYTINDGKGGTATASVAVTVHPVNDAPVATGDSVSVNEDGAVAIAVLANDSDPDGDVLTVTGVGTPAHGLAIINSNGTITYTPNANYHGPDSFTYTISDGKGGQATASVSVTVNSVNDVPVADADAASVIEGGSVTVNVLSNDSDADGDALSVIGVGTPANGNAVLNGNGTITYTPNAGYTGPDGFSYTISDGKGGQATANVAITVNSDTPNTVPVATSDDTSVLVDGSVTVKVLANDYDLDGDSLAIISVSGPASGFAVVNPNGTITYTPNAGYSGPDSFTYTVADGKGGTAVGSVNVNVVEPVSGDVEHQVTFRQGVNGYSGTVDTQILQSNTGANHANTAVIGVDRGTDVQVLLRFNDLFGNGAFQVPPGSEILSATLTLQTTNTGNGATLHRMLTNWSDTSTWASIVSGVQTNGVEALTAADVRTGATNLGASSYDVTASVQAWAGGQANLGWVFVSLGTNGWDFYSAQGSIPPQLTITYRAPGGQENVAPTAAIDAGVVNEDGSVVINPLANDTDPDGGTLTIVGIGTPTNGVAVLNSNGTVTYTPNANYNGPDSFSYTISDGQGGTASGTITIVVKPVNDAPVAAGDGAVVTQGGLVVVDVLANDSDVDGDALSVIGVGTPAHGIAVINSDGTVTYTPAGGYSGSDSFSYTISDGKGGEATGTAAVTVNASVPVNTPPVANPDSISVNEDGSVVISVLANDTDANGHALTVTGVGTPGHGTVVINGNGTITYTPTANYHGPDSFTYTISDGHGGAATGAVSITVNPVNDAPVANADTIAVNEDAAVVISVLANDTDIDGDTLTVIGVGAPAHGSAVVNSNGTITYTPSTNYNGADSFTYTISDGKGGQATGTVNVTVNPINDAPVANADSAFVQVGASVVVPVLLNDVDVDGDALTVTGFAVAPQHGTAVVNGNGTVTYTPSAGYVGVDAFIYTISDGKGGSASATVTVNVTEQPDDPLHASYIATAISGSTSARHLEHSNSTKSFYFAGAWWAILPNSANWSIHKFNGTTPDEGQLGGWTIKSTALFASNSSNRADLAWDPVTETLYVMQYNNGTPRLFALDYAAGTDSWVVGSNIVLAGSGGVLSGSQWTSNIEMRLSIDQNGVPVVSAIGASGSSAGLHLGFATSSNLSTWGQVLLDATTDRSGGSNGDSKADIVFFTQGGANKIAVIYSRDGAGSDNDWSIVWRDTPQSAADYVNGWQKEVITDDVNIDNHMAAVSDGTTIYAVIKDDDNSLWLLKGHPGNWDAPLLIVEGGAHDPSRPGIVLDHTNDRLFIYYQESTSDPEGAVFLKVTDADNPTFDSDDIGMMILQGTNASHDMLDPQRPAHAVGTDTGNEFIILAKNQQTNTIWYNDVDLGFEYSIA